MALALGQVRAVGGEQRHRGHEQQGKRPDVGRGDHHSAQAQAGVARGHDEVHPQHLDQRLKSHQPLGERDRGGDQRRSGDRGDLGGDQRRDPGARVDRAADGCQRVHHEQRDAGVQRQLAQVEHELDRRQAAVEQQHEAATEQASDPERLGATENETEHERDVPERKGVRPAAEVQVDDAALGDRERDRNRPPGQVGAGQWRQPMHRAGVKRERGREDQHVEAPYGVQPADRPKRSPEARRNFGPVLGGGLDGHPRSADGSWPAALRTSIGLLAEKLSVGVEAANPPPGDVPDDVVEPPGVRRVQPACDSSANPFRFPGFAGKMRGRERRFRPSPVLS